MRAEPPTITLTLEEGLRRVQDEAGAGRWAQAEALCAAMAAQMPPPAQPAVQAAWIGLLRRQQRPRDAATVLHGYLARQQWFLAGRTPAPVLLLYGLETVARGDVQFLAGAGLTFHVNGGHFDSTRLLQACRWPVDRLFLPAEITPAQEQALAGRLAGYRVVVNTIADPAAEPASLQVAQRLCERAGVQAVNAPAAVLASGRDEVARRLQGIEGLRVPAVLRLEQPDPARLLEALQRHPAGLILRPENSQTGIGVALARDADQVRAWCEGRTGAVFATGFHDFRGADGLYRKHRVFAVGGRLWPEHRIASAQWNIHSADRRERVLQEPGLQAEERAFLADPQAAVGSLAWRALQQVAPRLGLDCMGIDFGLLPSGEALLFEANAAMRLNYDHCEAFPCLRPHLDAVPAAFAGWLAPRLHAAGGSR